MGGGGGEGGDWGGIGGDWGGLGGENWLSRYLLHFYCLSFTIFYFFICKAGPHLENTPFYLPDVLNSLSLKSL